jgi:Gpi16 subunit, GPI transamidase component
MNGQDSQQQHQDAAAASIGMLPPQYHHYKYNYRESISISSHHVQLSSSALLDYRDQQYSRLSPFSSIIQDILLRHSALSVHIQVNGQATTDYYDSSQDNDRPIMTGPSGVHIKVQFADPIVEADDDASYDQRFLGVLDDLQRHRIVLAPLHAITQHRLHRHIGRTNTTQLEVTMPMEGSSMSSEGLAAFLNQAPCRGIWTLATPTVYSRTMLQKPATSLWIHMRASSRHCFGQGQQHQQHNKLCRMQHSFGMMYGRGANEVTLSQCLPGTAWKACPLANETTVTLPKAVHYLTTDTDWNAPLWNTANNKMDPPPVPLYSLHKTVLRPTGMANTGTLQTVVTSNTNVSVAISLLDIIPTTYIRPKWTALRVDGGTNVTLTTTMDGTMLELLHQGILAPHSTLTVSLDYNPILLNIDSFPADPNRGMEVPPSVLEIAGNTLYSNSLLILPPVPDMSMPYNVISLTCTMYVFLIGSMVNLLVKRASDKVRYAVYPEQVQKSKVRVLRERWAKWRDGMKQRLLGRTAMDMDHKKDQ